jgi:hypothetical protein
MEYRISDYRIMIGWPHSNGFCAHWYIARRGIGAELGESAPGGEAVLLVDYDALMNTVDIIVAGAHQCRHGRE